MLIILDDTYQLIITSEMLCCNGVESEKVRRQIGASWFAPVLYSAPSRPDAQIPFRKASDGFVTMRIAALRFACVRF